MAEKASLTRQLSLNWSVPLEGNYKFTNTNNYFQVILAHKELFDCDYYFHPDWVLLFTRNAWSFYSIFASEISWDLLPYDCHRGFEYYISFSVEWVDCMISVNITDRDI